MWTFLWHWGSYKGSTLFYVFLSSHFGDRCKLSVKNGTHQISVLQRQVCKSICLQVKGGLSPGKWLRSCPVKAGRSEGFLDIAQEEFILIKNEFTGKLMMLEFTPPPLFLPKSWQGVLVFMCFCRFCKMKTFLYFLKDPPPLSPIQAPQNLDLSPLSLLKCGQTAPIPTWRLNTEDECR